MNENFEVITNRKIIKPFLRWVGGKQKIINKLIEYLPCKHAGNYWEPFLGSGSLFFALAPIKANLSDENAALINCFMDVRDNPSIVYSFLNKHLSKSSEKYYYEIRNQYNESSQTVAQTARFIYLNKTSFNGIYRVNRNGKYNVPYGFREPPPPLEKEHLLILSSLLKNARLMTGSYMEILLSNEIKSEDFIYLDPPYPHYTGNGSSFNHYTDKKFDWTDHKNLALIANQLNRKGCKIMISYLDDLNIRSLYSNWNINSLSVMRYISSNGTRKKVPEIVITNYSSNIISR
jgi:DNA adenine methylase